jgi:hypothetical protein
MKHIQSFLFFQIALIFLAFLIPVFAIDTNITSPKSPNANDITITKTVSDNRILKNESVVVTIIINNAKNITLKDISLSDIVPPMFSVKPETVFPNNIIIRHFQTISNSFPISYSITPKNELDLSKDWEFQLPPSQVTFKIANDTKISTKTSNPIQVTLVEQPDLPWYTTNWVLYVLTLLIISAISGLVGGLINYLTRYKINLNTISRSFTHKINDNTNHINLEFDVKYDDNISLNGQSTVSVACFEIEPGPNDTTARKMSCDLFYDTEYSRQSFDLQISKKEDPKISSKTFVIERAGALLRIGLEGISTIENPQYLLGEIKTDKPPLKKHALAGLAAGLIVLLFLQVSSSLVTNHTYPANVQSMITLTVTAFIAGFIPFQILDRATSQLENKVQILERDLRGTEGMLSNTNKELLSTKRILAHANKTKTAIGKASMNYENKQDQILATPDLNENNTVQSLYDMMTDQNKLRADIVINNQQKKIYLKDIGLEDLAKKIKSFEKSYDRE